MGRTARAVFGGLLVGAGDTMVKRADNKLEDERQRRADVIDRLKEKRRFEQQNNLLEQQSGLLQSTQPDENGSVQGVTRAGDVIDLGFKAQPTRRAGDSGMSAGDKRILDAATAIYTTKDLSGEQTDWSKVAKHLRNQGYTALAQMVDPGKDDTGIDPNSDQYLEAQRMAEEAASDQAGFFSTDSTDFKDYGGNRSEFVQAKTMEFYRQLSGKDQASGGTSQPAGDTNQAESGAKPPGSGTQSDPYRATSQADVDWFKANAPAGTIIEVDGNLYRK